MLKKRKFILIGIGVLLLLFSGSALFWWEQNIKPPINNKNNIRVLIPKGLNAQEIGDLLYQKNLIRSPLAFKFYVQFFGKSKHIQAGEFSIAANLNLPEVINALSKNPLEVWVTVPEGLRREEIPELFIKGFGLNQDQSAVFRTDFLEASKAKEGYLFPDTYLFEPATSGDLVVKKMLSTFDSKFSDDMKQETLRQGRTIDEIVILASIIERETKTKQERPIVAGIYYRRLDIGMGLQADATVQYAIANVNCPSSNNGCKDWWPNILKQDLELNSQFNTYKNSGLPPSPIANPGLSSLQAAVYPEDMGYLYYIHDSGGVIHYAKTLAEHNLNINKYLGK